ncbi:MAG: hypothetical protein AAGD14_09890 [Planctomycetota bacterium]
MQPRRRLWIWIATPFVGAILWFGIWSMGVQSRFEEALDALRAEGQRVELEEFVRAPIEPRENGAVSLIQAVRWYDEHLEAGESVVDDLEELNYYTVQKPYNDPEFLDAEFADVRAWLAKGDPFVTRLREVVARPEWREDLDWSAGPAMELPVIDRMRRANVFLENRVIRASRFTSEVLDELVLQARLARQVDVPTMDGLWVTWTYEQTTATAVQRLSRIRGFDVEATWAAVHAMLRPRSATERVRRALREERAIGISMVRRLIDGEAPDVVFAPYLPDEPTDVDAEPLDSELYASFLYRDGTLLLELVRNAERLLDESPQDAEASAAGMVTEVTLLPPFFVTPLFSSTVHDMFEARVRYIATMRVGLVGLALTLHRQRTGTWPKSLDAIVGLVDPQDLIDPFTDQRLHWEPGVRLEAAVPRPDDDRGGDFWFRELQITWEIGEAQR